MINSKTINLPVWTSEFLEKKIKLVSDSEKMNFVLNLAKRNIEEKTGGPFAAAVFNGANELISIGVNIVVESNCSVSHAEVVAITMAEEELKTYRLDKSFILVSSAQPCVMCNGALLWSGISTLIYGATKDDVEEIVGFDEGPIHPNWVEEFEARGIKVIGKVIHDKSREVLQLYKENEGVLY